MPETHARAKLLDSKARRTLRAGDDTGYLSTQINLS
jgi:hypothetical protein